jgi:hypothetical protein
VALADPLLIHAELLHQGGERLQEISQLIFDKHLSPRIDRGQSK